MKVTAPDLAALGIVDEVISEVPGGAHSDPAGQASVVGDVLERQLAELDELDGEALVRNRYDRLRALGVIQPG
jgi:acetyl-CoA carboxylase carboxyl transferase subunit alpha